MFSSVRARRFALVTLVAATMAVSRPAAQMPAPDRLAAEIARWSARVADTSRTDDIWVQVRGGSAAALDQATQALKDGRRWYALDRFAAARANLAAAEFVGSQPADVRTSMGPFEAAWTRVGAAFGAIVNPRPAASTLSDVGPAAVRAEAEAALAQVRTYYETSLQYGQNTTAASGLFYLGLAEAQRQFVALARTLGERPRGTLPVRSLATEIDALQTSLLTAYVPPASIDRHDDFIAASAAIKEARELDHLAYHHGALLKYLQAAVRVAVLRAPATPFDAAALTTRVADWRTRVAAFSGDTTLAAMLVERAEVAISTPNGLPIAAAIAADVLPKYLAATAAPAPAPNPISSQVTVTLVRWPYT